MQLPDLPPDYYLRNFHSAVDWVAARYADLLSVDEGAFIDTFRRLPASSQALLVRLVMRKGPHFRLSRLRYPEIGEVNAAAAPLLDYGWLREDHPLEITELCGLLRREELVAQFAEHAPTRGVSKHELSLRLLSACPGQKSLRDWCPQLPERLLTLTVGEHCDRLRLLFFGNLNQDWSEFVLADLGVFRYELVAFGPASRGFDCRRDVDDHLHLHRCREALDNDEPVTSVLQRLGDFTSDNRQLRMRHAKLLFRMGQRLERSGEWESALQLYQRSAYPGARQRGVRVLEKLERYEQAWSIVQSAIDAPESDGELQLMLRARARLAGKLGQPRQSAARHAAHGLLQLELPRPAHGSVELAVSEYLTQPDAPVYYVENTLINSLFGLLFWEAVFAPLPGAFFHPFQAAPADLHDADFRQRRQTLFAAGFAQLDSDAYRHTILHNFRGKYGLQSPFVFWGALDEGLLGLALLCLPAMHLKACFDRLLDDIKANRAGMPDLIQFWPGERRYRMIEVKGPGDRLQDNQRRWLDFCADRGLPVDVCHVRWTDA